MWRSQWATQFQSFTSSWLRQPVQSAHLRTSESAVVLHTVCIDISAVSHTCTHTHLKKNLIVFNNAERSVTFSEKKKIDFLVFHDNQFLAKKQRNTVTDFIIMLNTSTRPHWLSAAVRSSAGLSCWYNVIQLMNQTVCISKRHQHSRLIYTSIYESRRVDLRLGGLRSYKSYLYGFSLSAGSDSVV